MSTSSAPSYKYTILAVGVGNALEWYDFAIFGALADVFGKLFFPAQSSGAQLMSAFSVYCSAFFMRPFGGLLFGHIGDTYGRKRALEISIGLMIVVSFSIGVLPTVETAGMSATVLVVMMRMLQGVAVGGEMVGAYIYTVEGCPDKWIAFWSGVCKATGLFGTVLGMGFVALLREYLDENQFLSWGWRVPFVSSIVMGGIGVYLRTFLHESTEFVKTQAVAAAEHQHQHQHQHETPGTGVGIPLAAPPLPVWEALSFHWPEILSVGLIVSFWAAGFYTSFVWMAYYTSDLMGAGGVPHAWLINTAMMGVFVLLLPCMGFIADTVANSSLYQGRDEGYRKMMVLGALIVVVFASPVFYLMNIKTVWSVCGGYFLLSLGLAIFGSCLPGVMVRQFSVKYRYSAMGIAYNVANAIFAGCAPLVQTALVLHVHTPSELVNTSVLPAGSLMTVGLLSVASLLWGPAASQMLRSAFTMREWRGEEGSGSRVRDTDQGQGQGRGRGGGGGGGGGGGVAEMEMDSSVSSQYSEMTTLDSSVTPMIR